MASAEASDRTFAAIDGPELSSVASLFRSLGHPLRLAILSAFDDAPLSSSELERRLHAGLGLVANHVHCLHEHGCLELFGTRRVHGSVESFYALTDRGRRACALIDATARLETADPATHRTLAPGHVYANGCPSGHCAG
jgi:hypothetical protein